MPSIILALVSFLPNKASADLTSDPDYLTIGNVIHEEIAAEPGADEAGSTSPSNPWSIGALDLSTINYSEVVNLGLKLWSLVQANRPVSSFQGETANALPTGVGRWDQLAGWQIPRSRIYRLAYQNLYGMTVVDFTYRVLFSYGGSAAGRGAYLAQIKVLPADLSVAWGYTFAAKGAVPSVLNTGTELNPVAGAEIQVNWSVDTVLKHTEGTSSYFARGDGQLTDLSNGR